MTDTIRISHVIYRLAMGGMENGLVNLVNRMDNKFQHQIVSLTDASDFQHRIKNPNVVVTTLNKKPGKDFGFYMRLFKTLREFKPTIVHTRNFGTVDCALVAKLAGGAKIIHSEHGWDMGDLDGSNQRYIKLRKLMSRLAVRYLAVSKDIEAWLHESVGIAKSKLTQIYNGVDTDKFCPAAKGRQRAASEPMVIGFVGRIEKVKNPQSLLRALQLTVANPKLSRRVLLRFVGDGSERETLEKSAKELGVDRYVEFLGACSDVPELMRNFDVFALPSFNEGISNTILEAMASGVPVVAARVGGNPELVNSGQCGMLYTSDDTHALSNILLNYANDEPMRADHGSAARSRVEHYFSLDGMVLSYQQLYQSILAN